MKLQARALGWRAHAALRGTGGRARVIAALSQSCYADAGGDLVWLGPGSHAVHPRAVMVDAPLAVTAGDVIGAATDGLAPWRPVIPAVYATSLRTQATALVSRPARLGAPRGLARLVFVGAAAGSQTRVDALTGRARPHASRLAAACAADDAAGAVDPALALLGLGDGLTPSGDDYVGGALFARRVCGDPMSGWAAASARIVAEARTRTHPISARLLADLANGEGWASLHQLLGAMAARDDDRATTAAQEVVSLGASSGWELLAGFVAALIGPVS